VDFPPPPPLKPAHVLPVVDDWDPPRFEHNHVDMVHDDGEMKRQQSVTIGDLLRGKSEAEMEGEAKQKRDKCGLLSLIENATTLEYINLRLFCEEPNGQDSVPWDHVPSLHYVRKGGHEAEETQWQNLGFGASDLAELTDHLLSNQVAFHQWEKTVRVQLFQAAKLEPFMVTLVLHYCFGSFQNLMVNLSGNSHMAPPVKMQLMKQVNCRLEEQRKALHSKRKLQVIVQ